MPTRTGLSRPNPTRSTARTGRFTPGAGGAAPRRGPTNAGRRPQRPSQRRSSGRQVNLGGLVQRRRPQSRSARIGGALSGVVGGLKRSAGKGGAGGGGRGKKGAGLALLTAAAGMAYSNRGRLTSMFGGSKDREPESSMPAPTAPQPSPTPLSPSTDAAEQSPPDKL
jgi:hypothetical protein